MRQSPSRESRGAQTEVGPRADLCGSRVVFHCGTYNLVPRGTQMPYSAAIDLVARLGMAHPSHRWTYREGTLVDGPSRTTSSLLSSYSLKEIVPKREPIPVIDLSDDESVEEPETAPVTSGIGLGTSIEEDLIEPTSDSKMMPELEGVAPADAEVLELLVFRNMSGSQSPNHADEAVSESSQNRQSEPIREATPRPEQATHKVIENFMTKMTELLETLMATRRNERVPATGAHEALERFLKFRPPEFYGEVEQEIKAELFLEQLNDIYDTFKYEDALRLTFAAFGLRGMANDWWLRASEARTLRTNHRKTAIGSAATPYKRPRQGPGKPRDFKRSHGK
ncbi:hypothetical protein M9H77_28542 [Catharanthus roseus]|uniref:Uncharacterized protein n=1 Tax=Catharanthus roseus TaxID=4058 RepID=A0ACC0AGL8_CATRO|nr:hypothetical protein M9H77_28542 [Catharanthus roseus]